MADGNKRYLGDVFIDEENLERQRQFLRDVIESYQYEHGFDATTLQGMTPSDFATREQGEKADNALLSPLLIGRSSLFNFESPQYIYTDGVLLDRENEDLNLISWYDDIDDLSDALKAIYDNTNGLYISIENELDAKANTTDLEEIEDFIENSSLTITENNQEIRKLNADFVNGFRFILISSTAYENLDQEVKENWRNIFIVRDDVPPEYENPSIDLDFSVGYDFRINNGILQYTNGLSTQWKNICSLSNLLEGANILDIIKNFIEDNQEYIINEESFLSSLQQLSPNQINLMWQDYPFLSSSLHNEFVQDIKINNSKNYITDTVNDNGFKNTNINLEQVFKDNNILKSNGDNVISEILTSLNDQLNSLSVVNTSLGSVQQDVQELKENNNDLTEINSKITRIENNINSINSNISSISNRINRLGTYTKYTGTWINTTSDIFYNDETKIAYAQIQKAHDHKKANSGSWVKIGTLPAKFTPVQGFKVSHSPNTTIFFKADREIHIRVDKDANVSFTMIAGGAFYYK